MIFKCNYNVKRSPKSMVSFSTDDGDSTVSGRVFRGHLTCLRRPVAGLSVESRKDFSVGFSQILSVISAHALPLLIAYAPPLLIEPAPPPGKDLRGVLDRRHDHHRGRREPVDQPHDGEREQIEVDKRRWAGDLGRWNLHLCQKDRDDSLAECLILFLFSYFRVAFLWV
ncbi:hypothetical protein L484_022501 [Morus notabilis]|uniref:Uncharacterized protein n=1 Tax=Morus notabilis TaxID=981085 RepID=W9RED3_9ROSA|nr:hypothetical protein L484_022501 [Morus notabilis]